MPGGELEPVGRPGPASAEVAAEMSEIFARAGLGRPDPGLARASAVVALPPSRRRGQRGRVLTAVTSALVGLGAGVLVVRALDTPAPPAARVALRPQPQPQAPALPLTVLTQAASAPVLEATPTTSAVAKAPAVSSSGAARAHATHRMKLARLGGTESRARIGLGPPPPMAQPANCELDAGGEACRRDVLEADSRLRAAYGSAIRRGVSRNVLADYRNRWLDLRERDSSDPAGLIDNYGALASGLGRENGNGQDAAANPKGHSRLRALAELLGLRR